MSIEEQLSAFRGVVGNGGASTLRGSRVVRAPTGTAEAGGIMVCGLGASWAASVWSCGVDADGKVA
jgi:hypothetical protein